MSGDVQPRKRKDKKRRKDETVEQSSPAPPQINPQPKDNDDVNIHVYKERGTGGNICSKIIFILLSSALIVLIGLIITEYRGLTDLDTTIDTESKYAQIFEGWVDNTVDDHAEHDDIEDIIDSHEEHLSEEEVEENEASEEAEDEHDEEDDAETQEDDDVEQEEDDEDAQTQEDDDSELQEDDDNETQEDDNQTQEDDDVQSKEDDDTEAQDDDDDEPLQDVSDEKPNDDDEEDNSQPIDSQEDDKTDDIDDEEDNNLDQDDSEEQEKSKEVSREEQKDASEEEEAVDKKQASEETEDPQPEEDTASSSTSNMLVKVGVGLAILVVAHTVFIRKWKSAPGDVPRSEDDFKETTPDLSRRNTIVPPPSLQEIEQDIENDEEEYSDEEGEYSEEEAPNERQSAKEKYQDLRSTYSRSMTPESDPDREEEVEEEEQEDDEIEEEWEGESEDEDYNEEEDEELLKRLEAKYGKIDRVNPNDEEKQSDDEAYEHKDITSEDDWEIKDRIDEAQKTINNNAAYAIKRFDAILDQFPNSPRSLYGKAAALDKLADQKRSNDILQKALALYIEVLNNKKTPDGLFELVANQCISRLRFLGQYKKAISVHNALIERFPDNCKYSNQLAVTYLTINRISEARDLLQKIISKCPDDGFALVHYGFVLKTGDNNLEEAVKYMRKGIDTGDEGVIDGRFFFHLGDALTRLGRNEEALKLYEDGVDYGLFLSKYQRSLYNVKRLSAKPWWKHEDLRNYKVLKDLEDNWKDIRKEGLSILSQKGYFQDESENLRDKGDWKQFELFARGQKNVNNCRKCPITCQIIERNPEARFCKRGQTKFSVMHPGTHVWPHCGPTNCRLRAHLGLKVPQGTYIRVADDIRSWKEAQVLIFDDSFEHEVWHNGTDFRLVLIVDVWHPELTEVEKKSLSPI